MKKVIECINLEKKYFLFDKDYKVIPWLFTKKGCAQERKTLTNINLTINKGDVIGFVGKNGAGKSTLMKIIAGITMHTEGHLAVNGKVNSLINLGAGFNQKYTGRQNIYYKGLLMGMTRTEIDDIIDDIIEFCELGEYFDLPIYMYSSGMSARLGFALAIFADHDILIVDEVFSVGDKAFREKSAKKMAELFKSGKSIIFASHSDSQIRKFCNRAIFIDDSQIVVDGTVDEALTAYNNKYAPHIRRAKSRKNKKKAPKEFAKVNCKYYKKLKLLRINADINMKDADLCKIFVNGKYLGNMEQDVYVGNEMDFVGNKGRNSVFTKVFKNSKIKEVEIEFYKNNKYVESYYYNVLIRGELPKCYISTAVNTNNITVPKGNEQKFLDGLNKKDNNKNLKFLSIETSSLCNCRCESCLVGQAYDNICRENMSTDVANEAVNILRRFPSINMVQLNGLGEPLLFKGFSKLCRDIYEKTTVRNVLIYTNGMFLDENLIDELINIPLEYTIRFSIDGNTPEESLEKRPGSDYELTKNNIKKLLEKTSKNPNFKIGINNLILDDVKENYIPEFLLNDFGNIQIDSHKPYFFAPLEKEELEKKGIYVSENFEKRICRRCYTQATIRSNGDVIRCHWDNNCEMVMGNILETPFEEIWNGEKYRYIREVMKPSYKLEDLPKSCLQCHAINSGVMYKK